MKAHQVQRPEATWVASETRARAVLLQSPRSPAHRQCADRLSQLYPTVAERHLASRSIGPHLQLRQCRFVASAHSMSSGSSGKSARFAAAAEASTTCCRRFPMQWVRTRRTAMRTEPGSTAAAAGDATAAAGVVGCQNGWEEWWRGSELTDGSGGWDVGLLGECRVGGCRSGLSLGDVGRREQRRRLEQRRVSQCQRCHVSQFQRCHGVQKETGGGRRRLPKPRRWRGRREAKSVQIEL